MATYCIFHAAKFSIKQFTLYIYICTLIYIYIYIYIYIINLNRYLLFFYCHESSLWTSVRLPSEVAISIINSHTKQPVSRSLGLHFPSSISLIAHSCSQSHMHYIKPTQILLKLPSIVQPYTTVKADSYFMESVLDFLVIVIVLPCHACFPHVLILASVSWINPLACCFRLCLHLAWTITLKQGTQSMENYIREFLAITHYSDLPDIILIEFFCDGINQPLQSKQSKGPRSSLCQFLDYALLSVG